jgi:hypothetical protein
MAPGETIPTPPHDQHHVADHCSLHENGVPTRYVELSAKLEERLERNRNPARLAAKPSKRDVAATEARLHGHEGVVQLNTSGDFFYPEVHFELDVTSLEPDRAVDRIVEAFARQDRFAITND